MLWLEQIQSANWREAGWMALGAYSLGCLATGYYLVRWRTGRDLRELGSGSLGARNAGRVLGRAGFLATLTGDFAKGAFAVWMARYFTTDERLVALVLLAVVAGHIWPAQLRFRGGKGIATSLGGLLIYNFHLALAFAVLFAGGWAVLRKTVLAGLLAWACLPLVSIYWAADAPEVTKPAQTLAVCLLAGLVLLAHRRNLLAELSHFLERRNIHPKPDRPQS
ncbi:MAG: glycerol-3-phosphate acyltransferase [Verrucomicrobiota bacterium]|jgi:glycerol-3-phosphate acyltransferase PlsY